MAEKAEEKTETETDQNQEPVKRDYAKWSFGLILWLCAVAFFGSVSFITTISNFGIDKNADYVVMGILWIIWTHIIPFVAFGVLLFIGVISLVDLVMGGSDE